MHHPLLTSTLLSLVLTIASAIPLSPPTPPPSDGRAATLYKQQNLAGTRVATDYTTIPLTTPDSTSGGASCFNLNSLYGGWSAKTRSLVVSEGVECQFFTDLTCSSPSEPLCVKGSDGELDELPEEFDEAIKSVKCVAL